MRRNRIGWGGRWDDERWGDRFLEREGTLASEGNGSDNVAIYRRGRLVESR